MEALAVKQQIEVEQQMPVQVAESLRYARKEPADMSVLVIESVEDVKKLTAMMKAIRGE